MPLRIKNGCTTTHKKASGSNVEILKDSIKKTAKECSSQKKNSQPKKYIKF
jgi:hypothetical protein